MSDQSLETAFIQLIDRVADQIPPCRERSLLITKLQEATFWLVQCPPVPGQTSVMPREKP